MVIFPAIDLLDRRCVRLKQGRFDEASVYSDDPAAMALSFVQAGAEWVHVVDLSAARDPALSQVGVIAEAIRSVRGSSALRFQVGGGLRSRVQAERMLEAGAARVVIGSAAVSDPEMVASLLNDFGPDAVTVALDVRVDDAGQACVATHGWREQTGVSVAEALAPLLHAGLRHVLCTDIARDGMMTGPNVNLYRSLLKEFPTLSIQASGGVSGLDDLLVLREAGLPSAIVGKAIYEGAIDLKDAVIQCR